METDSIDTFVNLRVEEIKGENEVFDLGREMT